MERAAGGVFAAIGGVEISSGSLAATSNIMSSTGTTIFWTGTTGSYAFTITPQTTFNGSITDVKINRLSTNSTAQIVLKGGGADARLNVAGSNYSLASKDVFRFLQKTAFRFLQKTAAGNISIGDYALSNASNASYNIAIAEEALKNNNSGRYNVGISTGALRGLTSGSYNIAVGPSSLLNLGAGLNNTGVGREVMTQAVGFSSNNTGVGSLAGRGTSGMLVEEPPGCWLQIILSSDIGRVIA